MQKLVLTFVAALALPGCIPFVGGGPAYPEALEGYSTVVFSQQNPSAVATCIGRLFRTTPTVGPAGEFIVSSGSVPQYAIRSVTQKDFTQTQTMVRTGMDSNLDVIRCSANADFVSVTMPS